MPVIKQTSWPWVCVHLLIYGGAVIAASLIWGRDSNPILLGAGPVFAYSLGCRYLVTRAHRRGIRLMKTGEFDAAILSFQSSYEFFSRNSWIDRLRGLVLMSASALAYREMALANIAFCHAQAGRRHESREAYERTLREFPESGLAISALRLIGAVESTDRLSGSA